jgi:alpha,alpha-trehalase
MALSGPKRLASKLPRQLPRLAMGRSVDLNSDDVKEARKYIDDYWKKLIRYHPKDDESLVGLPKPYLVPSYDENNEFDYNELYYWDSYFMVQGMLDSDHKDLESHNYL